MKYYVSMCFLMVSCISFSQPLSGEKALSGNLLMDSHYVDPQISPLSWFSEQPKNPVKAMVLSFVLPGLGETYAESYGTAIAFFAAEVFLIGAYLYYDAEAIKKERAYEKIADDPVKGWNVDQYATYLINRANTTAAQQIAAQLQMDMSGSQGTGAGNRSWWDRLNQLERQMEYEFGTRNKFSHVLPAYGSQQYYELIGKYNQFVPGWWDYDTSSPLSNMENLTQAFNDYNNSRSKAKELFSIANSFIMVTGLNHAASAVNAWLQSRWYNENTKVSLHPHMPIFGEMGVAVRLKHTL